jgi:uncharacterized membrane protein (UPF0182 family)
MRPGRTVRLAVGAAAVFLLFVTAGQAARFYADAAWFDALGYSNRFWKLEIASVISWIVLFLGTAIVLWASLRGAVRRGGPIRIRRRLGDLEIAEALPEHWVRLAVVVAAAGAGLLVASPFGRGLAEQVLVALHAPAWGSPDPVLGRDPRFYIFYLPVLETLWSVCVSVVTWVAVGSVSLLLLTGRVRPVGNGVQVDDVARARLAWIAAVILVLIAAHFGLSVFEKVSAGPIGYTEAHGDIPARRLVAILSLGAAVALIVSQRTGRWRILAWAGGLLAAGWAGGLVLYPGLLQRLKVEPNELEVERPFLGYRIAATRRGFDLNDVHRVGYGLTGKAPPTEVVERFASSLPLWDERPLQATFDQLQGLLAYHTFPDVDADRYGRGDARQQVAVGVREFDPSRLAASARTWQNLHLRYSHGQGIVVTAVDRASGGGEPDYLVRDLPPTLAPGAPASLAVREPRTYFGELTTPYVLVPPDSLPAGGRPAGVPVGGILRRALLALALDSKNLLLRAPGSEGTLLLWRRQVVQRVRTVVPFLFVDADPHPVMHDGRIVWILDVYSATSRFPLGEGAVLRGREVRYVRAAAKAVVDGVTGQVSLYVMRPSDPLLATYRSVFPDLFRPLSEMPADLRGHLRYPRALFATQARVLQAYHMTDPGDFYRKQDLWSIGQEVYEDRPAPVDPYFLLMPFPGSAAAADSGREGASGGPGAPARAATSGEPEFLLTVPFTPRSRDNLSAFLLARNDGDHYGEMWLFDISSRQQVFGPRQIEVQIDQDPVISQQLSLWRQRGSRAIRGHLLLLPVRGFLLYVEPLFLEAEDREGAAPGLKRVIAATGSAVTMATTLNGALERLLSGQAAIPAVPLEEEAAPEAATVPPSALGALRALLDSADRALRAGDLVRFGTLWERIRSAASAPDSARGSGR